jgi:Serine/threonine protein phosphatase
MLSNKVKAAYTQYRWIKVAALVGLALDALLLVVLAGGFPPWAWRFLTQTLLQLPQLWQVRGAALLPALLGLCLLSLSLLLLWVVIISLFIRVSQHLWQDYRARQKLAEDLRVAEILAEHDFRAQEEQEQQKQRHHAHVTLKPEPPRNVAPRTTIRLSMSPSDPVPAQQVQRHVVPPRPVQQPSHVLFSPLSKQMSAAQQHSYPLRKASGDMANAFPGLSYPLPSAQRNDIAAAQTGPMEHEHAEDVTTHFPVPPSPAKPMRQQLRLVHPSPPAAAEELAEPSISPAEDAEEVLDLADALFIGSEEEPRLPARLDDLDDLGDISPEIVLPQHTPASLSRPTTSAIWGELLATDEREAAETEDTQDADNAASDTNSTALLRLIVGIGIDPGIVRKHAPNEDSLFVIQGERITDSGAKPAGLFIVADGMGGHVNGREASRSAIRALSDAVVPTLLRDVSGGNGSGSGGGDGKEEETLFIDMLKEGVHRANLSLFQHNRTIEGMMGTTLTTALVVDTTAYVANIGDSRTYLYRRGEGLQQVTRDHSIVARLVENGLITRDEIYTHPRRNQIYRCLGEHASVELDVFVVPLQAEDILLLCSDGLWEMIRDHELERLIAAAAHSPSLLCTQLVQTALSAGGADNISVVVVRMAPHSPRNSQTLSYELTP